MVPPCVALVTQRNQIGLGVISQPRFVLYMMDLYPVHSTGSATSTLVAVSLQYSRKEGQVSCRQIQAGVAYGDEPWFDSGYHHH
jgi:hypothetical protein